MADCLRRTSNDTSAGLYLINTKTGKVTDILPTFAGCFLTFAQRGTELYAADDSLGKVGIYSVKTKLEQVALTVGAIPFQPLTSSDRKQVYVSLVRK